MRFRSALLLIGLSLVGAGCKGTTAEPFERNTPGDLALLSDSSENIPVNSSTSTSVVAVARPVVHLFTDAGEIVVELYPDTAPKATENFLTLVKSGFYDGIKFHRRVEQFVIQAGDPQTKTLPLTDPRIGTGGPGYKFEDELEDEYDYARGTLAMANSGPNTNGSQFFIMLDDVDLPKLYTVFGRVTSGLEVVDAVKEGTLITRATAE